MRHCIYTQIHQICIGKMVSPTSTLALAIIRPQLRPSSHCECLYQFECLYIARKSDGHSPTSCTLCLAHLCRPLLQIVVALLTITGVATLCQLAGLLAFVSILAHFLRLLLSSLLQLTARQPHGNTANRQADSLALIHRLLQNSQRCQATASKAIPLNSCEGRTPMISPIKTAGSALEPWSRGVW